MGVVELSLDGCRVRNGSSEVSSLTSTALISRVSVGVTSTATAVEPTTTTATGVAGPSRLSASPEALSRGPSVREPARERTAWRGLSSITTTTGTKATSILAIVKVGRALPTALVVRSPTTRTTRNKDAAI